MKRKVSGHDWLVSTIKDIKVKFTQEISFKFLISIQIQDLCK